MTEVPDEVRALAAERDERRRAKEFAAADSLRDRIAKLGFAVIDGPDGPSFEPLAAGVRVLAPDPDVPPFTTAAIGYVTTVVGADRTTTLDGRYPLPEATLTALAAGGASGRAATRATGDE